MLMLRVSTNLAVSCIYSTDTDKVNCAHLGLFLAGTDPSLREGVKIAKIVILPERRVQLFSPLGHIFWYVPIVGWHPSHTTTFMSAASTAVDTFPLYLVPTFGVFIPVAGQITHTFYTLSPAGLASLHVTSTAGDVPVHSLFWVA